MSTQHAQSQEKIVLSRMEWGVMNAVWKTCKISADVTVGELLESMKQKREWNVSTLKTILERLVKKGALKSIIRGRTCFYAPGVERESVVTSNLTDFLDNVLEGTWGPLVAYLADRQKLDVKEIALLEKMLSEKQSKGGKQ